MNTTPGPWTAYKSLELDGFAYVVLAAGKVGIAKVYRSLEDDANAALIAAAPELLMALKTIHEWLLDDDTGEAPGDWAHPLFKKSYELAVAAIQKAEGR